MAYAAEVRTLPRLYAVDVAVSQPWAKFDI